MRNRQAAWLWIILACAASWPTLAEAATSPQRIGFQGKLLDTSNNPRNGAYDMTFRIFNVPTGGAALWDETQSAVPVANGVFNVELGGVTALTTGLFTSASAYLEIELPPDAAMTPRQLLLMSPYAFRALLADDLAPGNTSYVAVTTALQSGAVFHVSSATVEGPFLATGVSSFTASGPQTFSVNASSGIRVQGGTLRVEGSGGVVALTVVQAATVTATSGLGIPQGAASNVEGIMRWEPAGDLLSVGAGAGNKTMTDTDSAQTLTNKTLNSTDGNTVDATKIQTRDVAAGAPSEGMTLEWNNGAAQWAPAYASTVTVVYVPFAPAASLTLTADTVYLFPIHIPGTLSLNQIRYRVGAAVAGVTGDVGLYNVSGQRVANGGANSADFTTTGAKAVAMAGAPKVLQPGQYYFAMTCTGGNCRPRGVDLAAASAGVIKGLGSITGGAGSGSTLPASVTLSSIVDGSLVPMMSGNE